MVSDLLGAEESREAMRLEGMGIMVKERDFGGTDTQATLVRGGGKLGEERGKGEADEGEEMALTKDTHTRAR